MINIKQTSNANQPKPVVNKHEINSQQFIIEMSCGAQHSLALTIGGMVYGMVYGWANNISMQTGNRALGVYTKTLPYLLNELNDEKVKSI